MQTAIFIASMLVASFQLPASSFQLPATSFQLPASSFQLLRAPSFQHPGIPSLASSFPFQLRAFEKSLQHFQASSFVRASSLHRSLPARLPIQCLWRCRSKRQGLSIRARAGSWKLAAGSYSSKRLNSNAPFVPPNPNELDNAYWMEAARLVLGT